MPPVLDRQPPPYAVQVELVEGCSLRCAFCGIQGIRAGVGTYRCMTVETAALVAGRLAVAVEAYGWNPRLEFAMHGEPTMHPDWVGMLGLFRAAMPRQPLLLTTNGTGLLRPPGPDHWLDRALAHANVVAIDAYEAYRVHERIAARSSRAIPWYPDDPRLNPHRRRKPGERDVLFIRDISLAQRDGTHSKLFNHAGCAFPPSPAMAGKRCAKPFRELAVRWDGNVALCCDDWRGRYKVANVADHPTLEALWQHGRFGAARKRLLAGRRDFGACDGCTHRSYRVGLLPDQQGKALLPPWTPDDAAALAAAVAGPPYTAPVPRPWEPAGVGAPGLRPGALT